MRLYGRLGGVSRGVIAQFLPSSFISAQNVSRADSKYYKTVRNILETKKQMSVKDWRELSKICSDRGFGYQAYVALLSKDPGLSEVRKLFTALEEEKIFSLILRAQSLQAFKVYESECTEDDHKYILDTVDQVSKTFNILTPPILKPLLFGVGVTSVWKTKCEILAAKLSVVDSCMYELSAVAAFRHRDYDYAWDQLRKAIKVSFADCLITELYYGIIESHKLDPQAGLLTKLLDIIEEFSLMIPLSVAAEIDNILNTDIQKVSRFSSVSLSGHCSCCKTKLRKIALTSDDQQNLLDSVERRFEANCKFATYEASELKQFKMFLKISPPYSIVIDGANLFYRNRSHDAVARKTVNSLEKMGHKILLIGRNHMRNNKMFSSVFKNHTTFYVQNRSVDDAYIIYAAISAGPNTLVVSNDFYGTYYAEMPPETRLSFKKWQLSHQVVCAGYLGEKLIIPQISPICQRSEDDSTLHIPVVSDGNPKAFSPSGWLCIQRVTKEKKSKADILWPKRKFELEESAVSNAFKSHVQNVRGDKVKSQSVRN